MIIVPVASDTIKTVDELPFKVVSYTNNKSEGPSVLASPIPGGETVPIFFETINEINGKKVRYVKNADGYKVFETPQNPKTPSNRNESIVNGIINR